MADYLESVNEVNRLIPIQGVIDLLGLNIARDAGSYQVYSCPFHSDSTPSFYVSRENNAFNCFGCDRKGSSFKLAKEYLNFTEGKTAHFNMVIKWLTQVEPSVASVKILYSEPTKPNPDKKKMFYQTLWHDVPEVFYLPPPSTPEQKRLYISAIMENRDDSYIMTNVFEHTGFVRPNRKTTRSVTVEDSYVPAGFELEGVASQRFDDLFDSLLEAIE